MPDVHSPVPVTTPFHARLYEVVEAFFKADPRPTGSRANQALEYIGELQRSADVPFPTQAVRWMDQMTSAELAAYARAVKDDPPTEPEIRKHPEAWLRMRDVLESRWAGIAEVVFRHRGGMRQPFDQRPRDEFRAKLNTFDERLATVCREQKLGVGDLRRMLGPRLEVEPHPVWLTQLGRAIQMK